ncbi:MAG: hypothetical protein ACK5M3_08055 [Dysgonomonas sp.]
MNTTDLQAMGLTEMNEAELTEVDGGFWGNVVWFVAGLLASEFLDRDAGGDFADGWSAGGFGR